MSDVVGCGIDYGSSNSAVALAYTDRVEVVGEDVDDALAPSALYLHRDGRRLAGSPASELFFRTGHERTFCAGCSLARYGVSDCRQFRRAGSCNDSRLLWGVKRDLANLGFAGTNSWATDFPITELVVVTLALLKRRAERVARAELQRAVIGHPVVFAGAAGDPSSGANVTARARLREAAQLVGFTEVELCPEPAAAALADDTRHGSVLLCDFGAGTYDVAVLRRQRGELSVEALAGIDIGGSRFDEVLFETVVGPARRRSSTRTIITPRTIETSSDADQAGTAAPPRRGPSADTAAGGSRTAASSSVRYQRIPSRCGREPSIARVRSNNRTNPDRAITMHAHGRARWGGRARPPVGRRR